MSSLEVKNKPHPFTPMQEKVLEAHKTGNNALITLKDAMYYFNPSARQITYLGTKIGESLQREVRYEGVRQLTDLVPLLDSVTGEPTYIDDIFSEYRVLIDQRMYQTVKCVTDVKIDFQNGTIEPSVAESFMRGDLPGMMDNIVSAFGVAEHLSFTVVLSPFTKQSIDTPHRIGSVSYPV